MATLGKIIVVGGHGKVALHFARLATPKGFDVVSLIRSKDHAADIEKLGATPKLLSLEDASVQDLAEVFEGAAGVLFAAGAGGKGGAERTKAVDFNGAVKVFDAIEAVQSPKPRLVLVGAQDTRDMSKPPPAYYTAADLESSKKAHDAIGTYYNYKLKADRNLSERTSFHWTILRPGHLKDEDGTGKIALGKTALGGVPREDVAATLLGLFEHPGGNRLALDLISGETPIAEAIKAAYEKGVSDFHD